MCNYNKIPVLAVPDNYLGNPTFQRIYRTNVSHKSVSIEIKFRTLGNWFPADTISLDVWNETNFIWNGPLVQLATTLSKDCNVSMEDHSSALTALNHTGNTLKILVRRINGSSSGSSIFSLRSLRIIFNSDPILSTTHLIGGYNPSLYLDRVDSNCAIGNYDNGVIYSSSSVVTFPNGTNGTVYTYTRACPSCLPNCDRCTVNSIGYCLQCKMDSISNGTNCNACHGSCKRCSEVSLANRCLLCYDGSFLNFDFTCNTTCGNSYSIQKRGDPYSLLNDTCNCYDGQYYYPYGVCITGCQNSSLIKFDAIGRKICNVVCQPSEYFYLNGSCLRTCPSPMIQTVTSFCLSPCNNGSFYRNGTGSCATNCTVPNRIVIDPYTGIQYCDAACTQFIHPDGLCRPTCDFPNRNQTNTTYYAIINANVTENLCVRPCLQEQFMFVTDAKAIICLDACNAPYTKKNSEYCDFGGLSEAELKQVQTIASITGASQAGSGVASATAGLASPGNPAALLISSLLDILQDIKYMNITYPPKLKAMLKQEGVSNILMSILPPIAPSVKNSFPNYDIPAQFSQFEADSSFFVNFYSTFGMLVLLLATTGVTIIADILTRRWRKINYFCSILKITFKWNLSIAIFTTAYNSLVMYSSFEFHTFRSNNIFSVLSLSICIIMDLVGIAVFLKILMVIFSVRSDLKNANILADSRTPREIKRKYQSFEIVYESYKTSNLLQMMLMPVFIIRIILYEIVLSYLYDFPLVQTILMSLLSLVTVLYLIIYRPLKSLVEQVAFILQEMVLLVTLFSTFLLACMDYKGSEDLKTRILLGAVIIYCFIIFSAIAFLFMCVLNILKIKELFVYLKKRQLIKMRKSKRRIRALAANLENTISTSQLQPGEYTIDISRNHSSTNGLLYRETESNIILEDFSNSNFTGNNLTLNSNMYLEPNQATSQGEILNQSKSRVRRLQRYRGPPPGENGYHSDQTRTRPNDAPSTSFNQRSPLRGRSRRPPVRTKNNSNLTNNLEQSRSNNIFNEPKSPERSPNNLMPDSRENTYENTYSKGDFSDSLPPTQNPPPLQDQKPKETFEKIAGRLLGKLMK